MASNHDGHRDRMRQRFLKNGLSSFEEHEILEFLLFYAIPRKNTNEIAHELINKFGNIASVLDANIEVLQEVNGISENSAILLKTMPQLFNVYSNCEKNVLKLTSFNDIKKLAINQYIGEINELLKVVYLDTNCGYINCVNICTMNNPIALVVNVKKIIERAEKYNSSHLILMHNHPTGNVTPSREDVSSTRKVEKIFTDVNIKLIDHVVVSKNDALSMRDSGYLS